MIPRTVKTAGVCVLDLEHLNKTLKNWSMTFLLIFFFSLPISRDLNNYFKKEKEANKFHNKVKAIIVNF